MSPSFSCECGGAGARGARERCTGGGRAHDCSRVLHDSEQPRAALEHLGALVIAAAASDEARADFRRLTRTGPWPRPGARRRWPFATSTRSRARGSARITRRLARGPRGRVGRRGASEAPGARGGGVCGRPDAKLAAWLHVERSRCLDAAGENAAAADAMRAALALDGGPLGARARRRRASRGREERHAEPGRACSKRRWRSRRIPHARPRSSADVLAPRCPAIRGCGAVDRAAEGSRLGTRTARSRSRVASRTRSSRRTQEKEDWAAARAARHATRRTPRDAARARRGASSELRSRRSAKATRRERSPISRRRTRSIPADARTTSVARSDARRTTARDVRAAHASRLGGCAARARALLRARRTSRGRRPAAQAVAYLRDALAATPDDPHVVERLAVALPGARKPRRKWRAPCLRARRRARGGRRHTLAWLERLALVVRGDPGRRRARAPRMGSRPCDRARMRELAAGLQRVATRWAPPRLSPPRCKKKRSSRTRRAPRDCASEPRAPSPQRSRLRAEDVQGGERARARGGDPRARRRWAEVGGRLRDARRAPKGHPREGRAPRRVAEVKQRASARRPMRSRRSVPRASSRRTSRSRTRSSRSRRAHGSQAPPRGVRRACATATSADEGRDPVRAAELSAHAGHDERADAAYETRSKRRRTTRGSRPGSRACVRSSSPTRRGTREATPRSPPNPSRFPRCARSRRSRNEPKGAAPREHA